MRVGGRHGWSQTLKVFISYRRSDAQTESQSIYREISREFGPENVFYDVDSIPLGVNFKTYLENAVTECGLMLVIIGKSWIDARDDEGARRLEDPTDFVRIEVESALKQGLRVVPVLVNGAQMPKPGLLPESMQDLAFQNAAEIVWGRDLDNHLNRLIKAVTAFV